MTFAARTLADAGAGSSGGGPPATFTPVTHTYVSVGSFVETIPTPATGAPGPTQLVIELGGPGGGGSFSPYMTRTPPGVSGSGGSGALCRSTFALTSADYGRTFNITITPGADGGDPNIDFNGRNGANSTIAGLVAGVNVSMVAGGGQGGQWNNPTNNGGLGGVATGGQVNLSGNQGQTSALYPASTPRGGISIQGNLIASGAGGDTSQVANASGSPGQIGGAAFAYS